LRFSIRYRFDVIDDVREIEAGLINDVRGLGFEAFAQVEREI